MIIDIVTPRGSLMIIHIFSAGNRPSYRRFVHQISDYVNERCFCHRYCYRWQKYCVELWPLPGVLIVDNMTIVCNFYGELVLA
jgi:hypothetical protein